MFMIMVTFQHAKVTEDAVAIELRRLHKLYKINVIQWNLTKCGHHLIIMAYKRENTMTEEEAIERNAAYDAMLKVGLPATADQPAVPPKEKIWRPHHYPSEKLFDIPSFMHDLLHAICDRVELMNRPKDGRPYQRTDIRPYVFGKYKCIRVQPDCIPRIFSSDDVKKMEHALHGLGYEGLVRRAPEDAEMYVSRRAIGHKDFVHKVIEYENKQGERFKFKEEKRMMPVREPSIDELRRIVTCSKQYYQEMLKYNLDDSMALAAVEAIDNQFYGNLALSALFWSTPFIGALLIFDGLNRWISLARMKRDGTLQRLAYTATRRAYELVMSS